MKGNQPLPHIPYNIPSCNSSLVFVGLSCIPWFRDATSRWSLDPTKKPMTLWISKAMCQANVLGIPTFEMEHFKMEWRSFYFNRILTFFVSGLLRISCRSIGIDLIYIYRLYRFAMTRMLRHPKQDLVDELHKSHDSPKRIFPILLGSKRYLYFFIAVFESSNETFFFKGQRLGTFGGFGGISRTAGTSFAGSKFTAFGTGRTNGSKCGVPSNQLRSVKTP